MADSGWPESTAVWEQLPGVYSRVGDSFLVFTVLWGTAVRAYTVVWAEFLAEYSRVGDSCPGVDSLGGKVVWWSQCGGVFMFLRRPERIGWYLWTVLRSQLEEGADSEEELWVTDESDTEEEESDSGDGEDE